ncbi:hypothetical protein PVAP13_4NG247611 [Panicum virgatum]|uniref:Uncharacterized protein n=1 Tax=Panicum virgatum TaxID=38727 RepID=A0A8T0T8X4_PANVG|nr:hypothetical protein PVAP13_4NG247611 [Panicum virgatum]
MAALKMAGICMLALILGQLMTAAAASPPLLQQGRRLLVADGTGRERHYPASIPPCPCPRRRPSPSTTYCPCLK